MWTLINRVKLYKNEKSNFDFQTDKKYGINPPIPNQGVRWTVQNTTHRR